MPTGLSSYLFKVTKHTFPGQHIRHYPGATRNREEDVQQLEVKQHTPADNLAPQDGDITIIGTCAVSFPKVYTTGVQHSDFCA